MSTVSTTENQSAPEAIMAAILHLIPSKQQLSDATGLEIERIKFLAGDASDRTYHRVTLSKQFRGQSSLVLMLLSEDEQPKLIEESYDWVHMHKLLKQHLAVPELYFELPEHGCLLIEDYGDQMHEGPAQVAASSSEAEDIVQTYEKPFELCASLLSIPRSESLWCSRAFDTERLDWELQFYKKYFLKGYCNKEFEREQERALDRKLKGLAKELGELAKWFVHRDLHSRNIMVSGGRTALIDFQDARLGAAAYDLISLCFDSYVPLDWQSRLNLLNTGIKTIQASNPEAASEIEQTWKKVFLQRQLKVLGSFAYLKSVKNKPAYEKYIEPVKQMISSAGFSGEWLGETN